MRPALRLNGFLPQEVLAVAELAVELVVQVVAVRDDDDGRGVKRLLQEVGVEHHGKGLARALRMPEYADFAVTAYGELGALDGLADGKILVVARKNLMAAHAVIVEADEVPDDVQEPFFLEDALKESREVREGLGFHIPVFRLPLHEAVLAARDGPRLAHQLVGHDADAVVDEHAGDFLHVIADLRVCIACVRLLPARGLQLKEADREPVQEQQNVRPLGGVFHEGPLVGDDVGVPVAAFPRVLIIGNVDDGGFCLAVRAVADLNPVLQVVHEERVLFHQLGVLKVAELEQRFGKGLCRGIRVQAAERLF